MWIDGECIIVKKGYAMEQNQKLTPLAQTLRKNQTKEENLLWYKFLRRYPHQFRRQYVIGDYIVDFYCNKAKLAIELDGSQHYDMLQKEKDMLRTGYMETLGIKVLRFSNLEVLRQFRAVCEAIDTAVTERTTAFTNCKR